MKETKRILIRGLFLLLMFALWTLAVITIDVKPLGVNGTNIGFSAINTWFHQYTGVNLDLYVLTDWLGLVPVFVCLIFAVIGLVQLVSRKSLFKVDIDIILLGLFYVVVIVCYLAFEMIPINYRPLLINGFMEVSYPSSTTLLVLSVMPTLAFQAKKRIQNERFKKIVVIMTYLFAAFMVLGRLISGVHWLTDIIGAILISSGLYYVYKGSAILLAKEDK